MDGRTQKMMKCHQKDCLRQVDFSVLKKCQILKVFLLCLCPLSSLSAASSSENQTSALERWPTNSSAAFKTCSCKTPFITAHEQNLFTWVCHLWIQANQPYIITFILKFLCNHSMLFSSVMNTVKFKSHHTIQTVSWMQSKIQLSKVRRPFFSPRLFFPLHETYATERCRSLLDLFLWIIWNHFLFS